ncbi:MAG: anthranilate phosphoribosyltransferase [Chlamydiota bacterium]
MLCLEQLMKQEDLTEEQCYAALQEILTGANPHQTAAFLALMRAKGETAAELAGVIKAMEEKMIPVALSIPVLDIVGTGGDGAHTLNISTGSAILAASCGVKIAKHGNRSVSSLCGSADVLEALGIRIDMSAREVKSCVEEIGIGFMFAPHFHPAMQQVKEVRSALKMRTLFNLVGPLLNPAHARHRMVGVAHAELLKPFAELLAGEQRGRSLVFHGCGLDEISCVGPAQVIEINGKEMREFTLDPLELGLPRCALSDLRGGDAKQNSKHLLRIFSGEKSAAADTLALNAACALYVYGSAPSIQEGLAIAQQSLKEHKAMQLIEKWRNYDQ